MLSILFGSGSDSDTSEIFRIGSDHQILISAQHCYFSSSTFSMDARFARKIKRPQTGIQWVDTTKSTQANERTSSEHNIQCKKLANMLYQAHTNCS